MQARPGGVETLEAQLDSARDGWSRHRFGPANPMLPVPRLEFAWTSISGPEWSSYVVEYRMVVRHLMGEDVIIPLGKTKVEGYRVQPPPWSLDRHGLPTLPFRDGAHAAHDAAFFDMPIYAVTATGAFPVDLREGYPEQTARGVKARSAPKEGQST